MNYERIENYLHNELTEEERAAFEQEMAVNQDLADTVALYREIEEKMTDTVTAEAGKLALQQQLAALGKQHFGKIIATEDDATVPTSTATAKVVTIVAAKNKRRYFYWIGAAAAALLAIVLVRPLLDSKPNMEELYAQNAQYAISVGTNRSGGAQPNPMLARADSLLKAKKFDNALSLLDSLSITDKSAAIALAKGACYTETNDSARANQVFTMVQAQKDNYAIQAAWYKSLLYLKYKDVAACRATLLTIPKDSDFGNSAGKLLKNLPKA